MNTREVQPKRGETALGVSFGSSRVPFKQEWKIPSATNGGLENQRTKVNSTHKRPSSRGSRIQDMLMHLYLYPDLRFSYDLQSDEFIENTFASMLR